MKRQQATRRWELVAAEQRREMWRTFWHLVLAAGIAVFAWGLIFAILIVAQ